MTPVAMPYCPVCPSSSPSAGPSLPSAHASHPARSAGSVSSRTGDSVDSPPQAGCSEGASPLELDRCSLSAAFTLASFVPMSPRVRPADRQSGTPHATQRAPGVNGVHVCKARAHDAPQRSTPSRPARRVERLSPRAVRGSCQRLGPDHAVKSGETYPVLVVGPSTGSLEEESPCRKRDVCSFSRPCCSD